MILKRILNRSDKDTEIQRYKETELQRNKVPDYMGSWIPEHNYNNFENLSCLHDPSRDSGTFNPTKQT